MVSFKVGTTTALLALALTIVGAPVVAQQSLYQETVESYRQAREKRLQTDYGWLSVIDLYWLPAGKTVVGAGDKADLKLPAEVAPAVVGAIELALGKVTLDVASGVELTRRDAPISGIEEWVPGAEGQIRIGRIQLTLLQRGDRFGVRVKDPARVTQSGFAGLEAYPVDLRWKIPARLTRYAEPKSVVIDTVIETPAEMLSLGTVDFIADGQAVHLEALVNSASDSEIFIIFKDSTNGTTTYGAGRYLYARIHPGDRVDLDFNRAYNPPCAFTSFATCPLPPQQNRLTVPVPAGEQYGAPR
ncbi:MAG: DUF1684 domain-containing protein [Acidobacteriota bacterium]|nr:DUF1684 domain-containing protein [Acidobacteriota bacterium]MDH3783916.1 DUF1684 domain-containing protein [Acidobacteriota bacterium]